MLIGNDLDALLSAALLKTQFGWDVVGIYDYETIWHSAADPDFPANLLSGKYLAVDLDLYHPNIPSIGHHILEIKDREDLPGQRLALNPNLMRGISLQNYRFKYPLGTIHFLLWVLGIEIADSAAQMLIWLADSAYINGQTQRFRQNVSDWLNGFIKSETLLKTFRAIDRIEYEQQLRDAVIAQLVKISICQPGGQIRSRHLKMTGYQCQWHNPAIQGADIQALNNLITEITGWKTVRMPTDYRFIRGVRRHLGIPQIFERSPTLAEFLREQAVFSYVFPFSKVICITNKLNLKPN